MIPYDQEELGPVCVRGPYSAYKENLVAFFGICSLRHLPASD